MKGRTMTQQQTHTRVYRVRNWPEHFEGAKSKGYKNKTKCAMPCRHGLGYRRLVRSKDGAALFGAWCSMVQILSQHHPERKGWVTNNGSEDGRPYTPDDLECLTDIPSKHFAAMLEVASSEAVGWVDVIESGIPEGYHEDTIGDHSSEMVPLNSNLNLDSNLDSNNNQQACAKLPFGEFENVMLTEQEYAKLCEKHGKDKADAGIDELGAWLKRTGKQRKDHYACMSASSWVWEKSEKTIAAFGKKDDGFVSRFGEA